MKSISNIPRKLVTLVLGLILTTASIALADDTVDFFTPTNDDLIFNGAAYDPYKVYTNKIDLPALPSDKQQVLDTIEFTLDENSNVLDYNALPFALARVTFQNPANPDDPNKYQFIAAAPLTPRQVSSGLTVLVANIDFTFRPSEERTVHPNQVVTIELVFHDPYIMEYVPITFQAWYNGDNNEIIMQTTGTETTVPVVGVYPSYFTATDKTIYLNDNNSETEAISSNFVYTFSSPAGKAALLECIELAIADNISEENLFAKIYIESSQGVTQRSYLVPATIKTPSTQNAPGKIVHIFLDDANQEIYHVTSDQNLRIELMRYNSSNKTYSVIPTNYYFNSSPLTQITGCIFDNNASFFDQTGNILLCRDYSGYLAHSYHGYIMWPGYGPPSEKKAILDTLEFLILPDAPSATPLPENLYVSVKIGYGWNSNDQLLATLPVTYKSVNSPGLPGKIVHLDFTNLPTSQRTYQVDNDLYVYIEMYERVGNKYITYNFSTYWANIGPLTKVTGTLVDK